MTSRIVVTRNKGATFCQVAKTIQESQGSPAITPGSQKWKGKRPILVKSPETITITESQEEAREGSQVKEVEDLTRLPKTKRLDPRAWTIKYLTADSLSEILF